MFFFPKRTNERERAAYVWIALSHPALDDVVDALPLLYHFSG